MAGTVLALAVAVPVIAGTLLGDPAINGSARLYGYSSDEPSSTATLEDWQAARPGTVRVTFDTTANPYTVRYQLVAANLQPKTQYVLVNAVGYGPCPPLDGTPAFGLRLLGLATTGKAGLLSLKGTAGASLAPLYDVWDIFGAGVTSRLASGADLWLLPDPEHIFDAADDPTMTWIFFLQASHFPNWPNPEPGVYYSALGLPSAGDGPVETLAQPLGAPNHGVQVRVVE